MLLVISQSGETADTLARVARGQAPRPSRAGHRQRRRQHHRARIRRRHLHARRAGNRRRLDQGVCLHADGSVAAGRASGPDAECSRPTARWKFCTRWKPCPKQIEAILAQNAALKKLAQEIRARPRISFSWAAATRFPIALEGALKLKEISYIHAEGYSAAEMKHGPIALIDPKTPTVFLVPQDSMYDKTMANLAMIRARKGPIIALATEGDKAHQESGRRRDLPAAKRWNRFIRSWPPCRCNCSPITSPSRAAATWTSRATWPRA